MGGKVPGFSLCVLMEGDCHSARLGLISQDPTGFRKGGEEVLRIADAIEETGDRSERVIDCDVTTH